MFTAPLVFECNEESMAKKLTALAAKQDMSLMWAVRLVPSTAQIIPIGVAVVVSSQIIVPGNSRVPVK